MSCKDILTLFLCLKNFFVKKSLPLRTIKSRENFYNLLYHGKWPLALYLLASTRPQVLLVASQRVLHHNVQIVRTFALLNKFTAALLSRRRWGARRGRRLSDDDQFVAQRVVQIVHLVVLSGTEKKLLAERIDIPYEVGTSTKIGQKKTLISVKRISSYCFLFHSEFFLWISYITKNLSKSGTFVVSSFYPTPKLLVPRSVSISPPTPSPCVSAYTDSPRSNALPDNSESNWKSSSSAAVALEAEEDTTDDVCFPPLV